MLAAARSKVVVLLLLIYYFMYLPLFVGVCVGLCFGMHFYVLSSFATILTRMIELVALLLLSFGCLVTVNVL